MKTTDLGYLADLDAPFEVIVTPKASSNRIKLDGPNIRVYVTAVPEGGKATAVAVKLLSKAIGVPKTKIKLLRGTTSRHKKFQIM